MWFMKFMFWVPLKHITFSKFLIFVCLTIFIKTCIRKLKFLQIHDKLAPFV